MHVDKFAVSDALSVALDVYAMFEGNKHQTTLESEIANYLCHYNFDLCSRMQGLTTPEAELAARQSPQSHRLHVDAAPLPQTKAVGQCNALCTCMYGESQTR